MNRKYGIDLYRPDDYQIILADKNGDKYFIRISCLGINYLAHFVEDFEDTYKRKARILEFGDGISTIWWAKTFPENEVFSVGGDITWYNWMEEELSKLPPHKVKHVYHEQTNFYTTENINNMDYVKCLEDFNPPFDIIINDGGMREIVGDYVLSNADRLISPGGVYLRHDYEMAILGNWVGFRDKLPEWCRDDKDLGYEGFAHSHPEYSTITTTGNGLAGYVVEFGGVWRRVDHQRTRKVDAENKRLEEEKNA